VHAFGSAVFEGRSNRGRLSCFRKVYVYVFSGFSHPREKENGTDLTLGWRRLRAHGKSTKRANIVSHLNMSVLKDTNEQAADRGRGDDQMTAFCIFVRIRMSTW